MMTKEDVERLQVAESYGRDIWSLQVEGRLLRKPPINPCLVCEWPVVGYSYELPHDCVCSLECQDRLQERQDAKR